MVFADAILPTAANIAPRAKRSQGPAGWCASGETKEEMLAAWQEREAARELLRADPSNSHPGKSLKAPRKRLKRVRIGAVQRFFFEGIVSKLEVRIKDGDQFGSYKHLKVISRGRNRAALNTSKTRRAVCFATRGSFVIGGYSGSALCSARSRQRSSRVASKSSRNDPREHLSMIYLRSLRWRKPLRARQIERPLDPISLPLNCSDSP